MVQRLLTVGLMAELFKVCPRTIRRWSELGEIPAPVKIRGTVRWRLDEVLACIEDMEPMAMADD